MKSGLQFWGTNAPPFTISEIPYVNYKLIVYLTGFNNNNASFVSDGTTTYYWDPKAYSKVLSQTTQTDYEEGTTAEDLREFAKEKFGLNNGDDTASEDE